MMASWFEHPLTRGLPIDSPETTRLRREIIATKPFLRRIYHEWYQTIAASLPAGHGQVVELGAGAGFFQEYVADTIRSEVFHCEGVAIVLEAQHLPFAPGTLRAIVMTDVFHHIPDVRAFFADAAACVRPGGAVVMVEPWVSRWSRFVYGRLHHEPFRPAAETWEFAPTGPLSGANVALPWIVFERDRAAFERQFTEWRVESIRPAMPFRYLLSGGVSRRSLMPGWTYGAWRGIERMLDRWIEDVAMFATIVLRRTGGPGH